MNFIRKVGHIIKRVLQTIIALILSCVIYVVVSTWPPSTENNEPHALIDENQTLVDAEIAECRSTRRTQFVQGLYSLKSSMKNPASFDEFWTYRVEASDHYQVTYSATNGYGATIQETAIIPVKACRYE